MSHPLVAAATPPNPHRDPTCPNYRRHLPLVFSATQSAAAPERSSPYRNPLPVPSSTPASPPSTLQCPQPPPFLNRKRSLALLHCRPSLTPACPISAQIRSVPVHLRPAKSLVVPSPTSSPRRRPLFLRVEEDDQCQVPQHPLTASLPPDPAPSAPPQPPYLSINWAWPMVSNQQPR